MNNRKEKILYWVFTGPFCLSFLISGTLFVTHVPFVVKMITELGYPVYVLTIIGTAKILGVITVLVNRFSRLKEWAYAGFTINLVGAMASHALHGDSLHQVMSPVVPILLMAGSYISWRRL